MNNPNPFVPQGSLLEQKNRKRARVKVAVFSIFALNILVITPLLIQGCKKDATTDNTPPAPDMAATTNVTDTNTTTPPALPPVTSNVVTTAPSNVVATPVAPPPPPPQPVVETPSTKEYVVASGDSFYTIAKKFGVKMKDVQAANPGVVPTKLKAGQKLQIPASSGASTTGGTTGTDSSGMETYTVKSGDSLTKIAKQAGVTIKALRAANDMKTDRIKVGQKLKLPAKAPAADTSAAAPVAAPTPAPAPAPTAAPTAATPGH